MSAKQIRPLAATAQVRCRSASLGLQRVVTDFGADTSFAAAVEKVREHYRIEVNASMVRSVTQRHAEAMKLEPEVSASLPSAGVKQLLTEIDGTMLPVVEIGAAQADKRKQRLCRWQEARLRFGWAGR